MHLANFSVRLPAPASVQGLFAKLPSLRLAVPPSDLQWSAPERDIGLVKLPVTWD